MATVTVESVNRAWQVEECGPLVKFTGTRRSGMSMDFIVERSVAKAIFNHLYHILYLEPCTIQFKDYVALDRDADEQPTHYVSFNGAAHFVKEAEFFMQQGGLAMEWGKNWKGVIADDIEDARRIAATLDWGYKAVTRWDGTKGYERRAEED